MYVIARFCNACHSIRQLDMFILCVADLITIMISVKSGCKWILRFLTTDQLSTNLRLLICIKPQWIPLSQNCVLLCQIAGVCLNSLKQCFTIYQSTNITDSMFKNVFSNLPHNQVVFQFLFIFCSLVLDVRTGLLPSSSYSMQLQRRNAC